MVPASRWASHARRGSTCVTRGCRRDVGRPCGRVGSFRYGPKVGSSNLSRRAEKARKSGLPASGPVQRWALLRHLLPNAAARDARLHSPSAKDDLAIPYALPECSTGPSGATRDLQLFAQAQNRARLHRFHRVGAIPAMVLTAVRVERSDGAVKRRPGVSHPSPRNRTRTRPARARRTSERALRRAHAPAVRRDPRLPRGSVHAVRS
jgi:hypothetical protein